MKSLISGLILITLLAANASVQAAGTDASSCIVLRSVAQSEGKVAHQTLTNTCGQKVGIIHCHGPSALSGTKGTECGHNGRHFQQFSSMDPGETHGNQYNMPVDAKMQFGACIGGEGKIKQTTNGQYNCRL